MEQLRENGHRLRFVTNNTTHSRRRLAEQIRGFGIELEDAELQTTPVAAVHSLAGKRVLALTMPDIVEDLEGIELVGEGADAVLIGGADETDETNRVFSYMNLARAFAELQAGAELYCLHKNRWWQTSRGPLLDSGAFVAGLEYAAERRGDGAREAEPRLLRGRARRARRRARADLDGRRRHRGRHRRRAAYGLRTVLVRTGKFRPDTLERSSASAGRGSSARSPRCPSGSRPLRRVGAVRVGVDLIEIERVRASARALPVVPRALLHGGRARATATRGRTRRSTTPPGSPARRPSARRSASASRALHLAGDRDRRPPEARTCTCRGRVAGVGGARRRRADRALDDALAGARRGGLRRQRCLIRSTPPRR